MSGTKVWSRFALKKKDGTDLKFRIEEMPDGRLDDVMKLIMAHFVTEEATHRASGISKNPEAMKEIQEILMGLWEAKPNQIAICLSDDGTEAENVIIGASLMVIATKEDSIEDIQLDTRTKEIETFVKVIKSLFSKFNVLEKYGLDSFYDDRGVVVLPKYRGLGIAQEFFRVRRLVCKEHNIPMTAGWMTSFGSQKAAKRDCWETVFEVNYEEFGNQMGVVFENVPQTCMFMIARSE